MPACLTVTLTVTTTVTMTVCVRINIVHVSEQDACVLLKSEMLSAGNYLSQITHVLIQTL